MTCQEARDRIALGDENLWLDEAFEAHVSECDECAAYYADFCAMEQGLGDWAEQAPPEGLHETCMKALAAEEAAVKRRKRAGWVRAGTAIAAAFVVVLGTVWFTAQQGAAPRSQPKSFIQDNESTELADGGLGTYDPSRIFGPMGTAAPDEAAPEPSMPSDPGDVGGAANDAYEKKLVYDAHINMQTRDFDADRNDILARMAQVGGYVASQSSYVNDAASGGDGLRHAYLQLRIPAESFDAFLADLDAIGIVVSKSSNVVDISDSYYDARARLDSYQGQMERIDEILEKTETLADVLAMQTEIARLQGEIDSLTGYLKRLDSDVAYSTITIDLSEISQMSVAPMGSNIGSRMGAGFFATINGILQGLESALVWLVSSLPALILIAAAALVIFLIARRFVRKAREKRQKELGSGDGAADAPPKFDDPDEQ